MTGVYVQNGGRNYGPNDFIDETKFVFEDSADDVERYIVADPTNPDSTAQSEKARATERPPIFDITVDPVTGAITKVDVINILRFAVPPEFKIVTASGTGAILKPIFGTIPPVTVQKGLFTVIDCVS
jgi:hypothetical protein